MTIEFQNPDLWKDYNNASPPKWWELIATDSRWWFENDTGSGGGGNPTTVAVVGSPFEVLHDLTVSWEITEVGTIGTTSASFLFYDAAVGGTLVHSEAISLVALASGEFTLPAGLTIGRWLFSTNGYTKLYSGQIAVQFSEPNQGGGPSDAGGFNYNCVCVDNENETLAQLRSRMLIRLGFAAVASNPPPGMAELIDQFLITQNKLMYQRYPALRTRRLFKWTLTEGGRFYGIRENDQDTNCEKFFDVTKPIVGVYLRDLNGAWLPMTAGIPPTFYTTVMQPALPLRYEIRSCIEIFPAPPADGYEMWIKAQQTADAFAEDDDQTTVDSELVFLQALADALDYYGKPSAAGVFARANAYLGELVASTHITKRYVPGTKDIPPAIMPIFAPWPGEY